MSDYKLHTPNGVNDILSEECAVKREIEETIQSVFESSGYNRVETPMFEYYDCYIGRSGQISQETLFKFFDEQGRVLVLRPDFTTSIARMAATKETAVPKPLRYMYTGSVFRAEQTEGARQREFTQTGIELIGSSSPRADAEVIALSIEALMAVGIEEMTMEIGQVAFFNGLVEQAGINKETAESIRERIDSKDVVGIREIIKDLEIDGDIKNLIEELPYLFGDIEILKRARVNGLNETSAKALDNLEEIYKILCAFGFEKYISIDLGMLQSIDYYTGSIFKCYTHGIGFPVCAGGRYDKLMGNFGKDEPSVGVALGIMRIMTALGKDFNENRSIMMLYADTDASAYAYDVSITLRDNGYVVENYISDGDYNDAVMLSKERNIPCVIRVFENGEIELYDILNNERTKSTVGEFVGCYE